MVGSINTNTNNHNKKDNNFIDIEDYTTALSEIKARYELNSDNKERQRGI